MLNKIFCRQIRMLMNLILNVKHCSIIRNVLENLMMLFIKVRCSLQFKQQNEATNKMNCTLQVAARQKWGNNIYK